MKIPSTQEHVFSQVPKATIPRSQFNRSHGVKTTFDAGYVIPIFVDEALPGDTFNLRMTAFARLSTPIAPIMDNIYIDYFFFAVPYRLIWDNWKKFMGEQTDPGDSNDYEIPHQHLAGVGAGATEGSLADYFGLPTKINGLEVSTLPFRAYNLIWNEWFRPEYLVDSVVVDKDDGPDTDTDYVILPRMKRHDYFTSCLPWPEKDNLAVTIPLGTSAPVVTDGNYPTWAATGGTARALYQNNGGTSVVWDNNATATGAVKFVASGLETDLSTATSATINSLREAFQLQRMLERDARGGSRYVEVIRAHFGVISPDFRQQRPEYLGGGQSVVNIHPIAQTSSTDATTPQGNLAGIGTHVAQGIGFVKSFTEHCILIGLASARADLSYQEGVNRMWSRKTRYDFYWPALAHLGEQEVLVKEIFADNTANDELVFGYQERYAEYRYKPSTITGKFRSNCTTSLDFWHLAQEFGAKPVLESSFIYENPPMSRVLAVNTEPHFLFDAFFDLKCVRPMPIYSVPGLIDHF